jgi:single-strand DNA-binding protein
VVDVGLVGNHKWRSKDGQDREEVLFIDCSCFGKGAEVINTYCQKGKQLLVEGRLKLDVWEDKQGGGKRSKHSIVVENFQLMGGRDSGAGSGGGPPPQAYDETAGAAPQGRPPARPPQQARPAAARPPQQQPPAEAPFAEEQQFNEDDIPF